MSVEKSNIHFIIAFLLLYLSLSGIGNKIVFHFHCKKKCESKSLMRMVHIPTDLFTNVYQYYLGDHLLVFIGMAMNVIPSKDPAPFFIFPTLFLA